MRAALVFCLALFATSGTAQPGPEWSPALGPYRAGPVSAVHPSGALISAYDNGVYVSEDDGATWMLQDKYQLLESSLLVLPDGRLLALQPGADGNVIRSGDLGASWDTIASLGDYVEFLDRAPDGTLYAASVRDVYTSPDDGETWEELPPRPFASDIFVLSAGIGAGPLVALLSPFNQPYLVRFDLDTGRWERSGHEDMV